MKMLFTIILFVTFFSTSFSQNALLPAYPGEIIGEGVIGNIAYFKGDNRPFTGVLVDEKTQKKIGEYKNGYKNGIFTEYYLNGKKKSEYKYANGKIVDGKYVTYLENGKKEKEETYKTGKIITIGKYENGKLSELFELSVEFYSNGQKKSEGYLKNGKKDGHWVSWFEDGRKEFEGNYKNGMKDGQGILHSYIKGIVYNGGWKNNKKDGYGTLTWDDGSINYQGEWKNGKPDGQGITYNKGKKVYDGEWKNGKKNGKGTYNYVTEDGTQFYCIGYFVNDAFEGQGTMIKKINGGAISKFTGEFKNWDYFNGILHIKYFNGDKSVIEYKNGIAGETIKIK